MAQEHSNSKSEERKARKHRRQNEDNKAKSWIREWADALLWAAVAALIIRAFFFQAYRIPTPSMEKTLLTGDFLIVSKVNYGPRTPMVLAIPFTSIYLKGVTLPWVRLPGLSEVERNDIVVFNYPIDIAPISMKTSYVKRSVGIPGDTLAIRDSDLFVNGNPAKEFPGVQENYVVTLQNQIRLSRAKVNAGGGQVVDQLSQSQYLINMTSELAQEMLSWNEVAEITEYVLPDDFNEYARVDFNFSRGFMNHDHLPPIVVPFDGQVVTITDDNWHIYQNIVTRYEGNNVERTGETFEINGVETNEYTIKQDYYFMMGDNRDNSQDSRYWGFVPQTHIVGNVSFIYFSWDAEEMFPRFGRIFNTF